MMFIESDIASVRLQNRILQCAHRTKSVSCGYSVPVACGPTDQLLFSQHAELWGVMIERTAALTFHKGGN
jgi:hypothetical protein